MRVLPVLLLAVTSCGKEEGGHLMDLIVDGKVVATIDARTDADGSKLGTWSRTAELRDGMTVELKSHPNERGQVYSYGYDVRKGDAWSIYFSGTENQAGENASADALKVILVAELSSWVGVHRDRLPQPE